MAMFEEFKKSIFGPTDDELDDGLDYVEYPDEQPVAEEPKPRAAVRKPAAAPRAASGVNAEVVLVKPEKFDEATSIGQNLNEHRGVVLNLENCSKEDSRRLVDFLSGVAFANHGSIKRIATSTFLITTPNIALQGEEPEEDGGALYIN